MSISCDFLGKIQASSANLLHRLLWQLIVTVDTWVALGCISQNREGFFGLERTESKSSLGGTL